MCFFIENVLNIHNKSVFNFDVERIIIDPFDIKKPLPEICDSKNINKFPRLEIIFEHTQELIIEQAKKLKREIKKRGYNEDRLYLFCMEIVEK